MPTIQERALDLFDERGFGAVTIEEIAAAAAGMLPLRSIWSKPAGSTKPEQKEPPTVSGP